MSIGTVDVYDFEGNMADMIGLAFANANMNYATVNKAPDFQKPRPRSELIFRPGASVTPPRIMLVPGWGRVSAAYVGELEIHNITEPSAAGKGIHAAYRAQVRRIMEIDLLRTAVNVAASPYQIDMALASGATEVLKTEDGYETSTLNYHLQFSIKNDAFNQLAAA